MLTRSVPPSEEATVSDEAKPANLPLPAPDPPKFFHLWIDKEGGLNFELNMTDAPDKFTTLLRMIGNCHVALWQVVEWATICIRGADAARRQGEDDMRTMLEKLSDASTIN